MRRSRHGELELSSGRADRDSGAGTDSGAREAGAPAPRSQTCPACGGQRSTAQAHQSCCWAWTSATSRDQSMDGVHPDEA